MNDELIHSQKFLKQSFFVIHDLIVFLNISIFSDCVFFLNTYLLQYINVITSCIEIFNK